MGNRTINPRVSSKVKPSLRPGTTVRIGELVEATGVSRDSLRFYESLGLIESGRNANGYRWYPAATVDFVNYIKTAQRLGFTLKEIGAHARKLCAVQDRDAAVASVLHQRIEMIEHRINELGVLRDELQRRVGASCPLRRDLA